jgi:flagellar motor switch protein FliN/FliY
MSDENLPGEASVRAGTALAQKGDDAAKELERILEVPLQIYVELGAKRMRVRELLEVSVGSIVELDTEAGAQLENFANDTLIAQGEAVVVGEHYGVRITEIVSLKERFSRLAQQKRGL